MLMDCDHHNRLLAIYPKARTNSNNFCAFQISFLIFSTENTIVTKCELGLYEIFINKEVHRRAWFKSLVLDSDFA